MKESINKEIIKEENIKEENIKEEVKRIVKGKVIDCTRLNVRRKPNKDSEVNCIIDIDSVVEINESKSNDEWYRVITDNGVYGYCMKRYISLLP